MKETGGLAVGGSDERAGRTEMLVSHAGAAARLVNARGGLGVFHDLGDRVAHIEDKAGGKLAIGTAGIHQRRGVWQE